MQEDEQLGSINVSRTKPPGYKTAPSPIIRMDSDKMGIGQAGFESVMAGTLAGQWYNKAVAGDLAGLSTPLFRRVKPGYNVYRDENLQGLEPYLDEMTNIFSPEEFVAFKYGLAQNQDLRHNLEEYPFTNFISAGAFDLINLIPVPLVLGKGFLAGAKQAAKINAPLVLSTEMLRVHLDPIAEPDEIIYSTMGAMLFSGLIGGLAGAYKPIGKMTVGEAFDVIIPLDRPLRAEAGMFNWIRFVGKGTFRRVHDRIKSTAHAGGLKSDDFKLRVKAVRNEPDADGLEIISLKLDDAEVGVAIVRGGDTLQMKDIELAVGMRGQGAGTALYKAAIKYAQDNGLKFVSDTETSISAARVWRKLKKEGYNIVLNKTSKVSKNIEGKDVLLSGDTRANFEVLPVLEGQAKKMPKSLKLDYEERTANKKLTDAKIREKNQRIDELNQKLNKMDNNKGGRRTKLEAKIKIAQEELGFAQFEGRLADSQLADTNTQMSLMLDEKIAKDWDLLPTGYNKILGSIDQFPFWVLMKSPLKESMPEINRRMQMFALKMAQTPGLNTEGHVVGHAIGRSVEGSSKVHYSGFVAAQKNASRLYAKHLGLGENTGGFTAYSVDQGQRVQGLKNTIREAVGAEPKPLVSEGKLTAEEFDAEITLAILNKGEHRVPEVAEAAGVYIKWIEEIGEAARSQGLFATQKTIGKKLEDVRAEIKKAKQSMWHTVEADGTITVKEGQANTLLDELEIEQMQLESKLDAYAKAGSAEVGGTGWIHRLWRRDDVVAKEAELKAYLHKAFTADPFEGKVEIRIDDELVTIDLADEMAISARVDEAYASILREADHGGDGEFVVTSTDKREWLVKRAEVLQAKLDSPTTGKTTKSIPDKIAAKQQQLEELKAELPGGSAKVEKKYSQVKAELKNLEKIRDSGVELEPLSIKEKTEVALRLETINRKLERIRDGDSTNGGGSGLVGRHLDLDDAVLHEMGVIEQSVKTWATHYVMRMAPLIETSRIFGDARAAKEIGEIYASIKAAARDAIRDGDHALGKKLNQEAERTLTATQDLRDIVQGVYGIPDDPHAITGRVLRLLRNLNLISAMGRSTLMAFGDTGNVVISQGYTNTYRQLINHFRRDFKDGNIKMMEDEVELAGSAVEVVMAQRFHQMTELGGAAPRTGSAFNKVELFAQDAAQRFFLHNMMAPWTDMMRKVSGSMLQSKIISNAHAFRDGTINAEDMKVMARLGINKTVALQMLDEWEASGSLKHDNMFIANTGEWISEDLKLIFRSALNTEIDRMVPTPGAADKPKGLLKSEWWKVIGQYRGFSIGATHRIMAAGMQTNSAAKWSGISAMITIAMMVDYTKRPDYIDSPIEELVLRAVELSGVTGIILDLNDTIERASAGAIGLRPLVGMNIRERDPNWATRLGTAGAVPNQLLSILYAFGSDDADTADKTRAIRYMTPYNNLIWWNDYVNRMQRASTRFIEDIE
jgi:GNAT superfamily N-acetyltransferase